MADLPRRALFLSLALHALLLASGRLPSPVRPPEPLMATLRGPAETLLEPPSTPSRAIPVSRPLPVPTPVHTPQPVSPAPAAPPVMAVPVALPSPLPAVVESSGSSKGVSPAVPSGASANGPSGNAAPASANASSAPEALELPRYRAAYLRNPQPAYPPAARRRGIEGTVQVEALVGVQGEPKEVRLASSAGDSSLDNAALEAVRAWRFVPARRGEQAVEAWVRIPLVFHLD